jgi:hypothetical protein
MNKLAGWIIASFLLVAIVGYGIGTIAHTFYYMVMVVFSKLTFGLMYGLLFLLVLGIIWVALKRK